MTADDLRALAEKAISLSLKSARKNASSAANIIVGLTVTQVLKIASMLDEIDTEYHSQLEQWPIEEEDMQ